MLVPLGQLSNSPDCSISFRVARPKPPTVNHCHDIRELDLSVTYRTCIFITLNEVTSWLEYLLYLYTN